ncbi:MAG: hypothetical protein ACOC46_00585 [Pirellulales bacterium]
MGHATYRVGELTATIGDNAGHEQHRSGYNGVWSLRHATGTRSLFVPAYAGLNHEHIFDGQALDSPEVFFEPRHAPMTFRRISDREAELHQPPTPTFHLESWTRFTLAEPHYLDMHYRCVAHQHAFLRGYIGLFWASYINAPRDKSMYFLGTQGSDGGEPLWMQFCTQRHDDESTVRHRGDRFELTFRDDYRDALFRNFSPLRYDVSLFYGNFEEHVWIVMFDRAAGIRITHSPSGGGLNAQRRTTNPAWDLQFLVPDYDVNRQYGFRVRTVLRPRCSRAEVLEEYRRWQPA